MYLAKFSGDGSVSLKRDILPGVPGVANSCNGSTTLPRLPVYETQLFLLFRFESTLVDATGQALLYYYYGRTTALFARASHVLLVPVTRILPTGTSRQF